jgi:hypothetical protein
VPTLINARMRKGAVWEEVVKRRVSWDVNGLTHLFTVNYGLTSGRFLLHRLSQIGREGDKLETLVRVGDALNKGRTNTVK